MSGFYVNNTIYVLDTEKCIKHFVAFYKQVMNNFEFIHVYILDFERSDEFIDLSMMCGFSNLGGHK